jgi:aldehyde reductase
MANIPNVKLNNGLEMPIFGLGTWNSPKGEVLQAVQTAIDLGYRHIDCAHVYQNEEEVGEALQRKINDGTVKREDLFITSKLWNTFQRPDLVRGALQTTLKNLKLDYVDLYLIHWPMAYKEGESLFPRNEDGTLAFSTSNYVDTWKEMEKLVEDGLAKSIGVSNFNKRQIECILAVAKIPPANNQVECHPYLAQKKLSEFCQSKNIAITAYSPLGSPARPWAGTTDEPILLEDPAVTKLAEKYKKSPAQILLRFQVQRGHIAIPKSVTPSRIQSNMEIFDFEFTPEDLESLLKLDNNTRYVGIKKDAGNHPEYPFDDEY